AWHRGTREVDLIMGRFADAHINEMTPEQLLQFQDLLEAPDLDAYQWAIGSAPVPDMYDTEVMKMLQAFDFRVDGEPC
ncbi:MAG: succinate dehydrogenase assembly factor 2, partial [Alphaproteobacteria bacterium]|nr:succinate dehydrogenase assembly factor 2 [Alphaproteobacteria bacterium]